MGQLAKTGSTALSTLLHTYFKCSTIFRMVRHHPVEWLSAGVLTHRKPETMYVTMHLVGYSKSLPGFYMRCCAI